MPLLLRLRKYPANKAFAEMEMEMERGEQESKEAWCGGACLFIYQNR